MTRLMNECRQRRDKSTASLDRKTKTSYFSNTTPTVPIIITPPSESKINQSSFNSHSLNSSSHTIAAQTNSMDQDSSLKESNMASVPDIHLPREITYMIAVLSLSLFGLIVILWKMNRILNQLIIIETFVV